MDKEVIIIANPGIKSIEEAFYKSVLKDVENYIKYFMSAIGGAWEEKEIKVLYYQTEKKLKQYINSINKEYVLIVFTGHGYYNTEIGETILQLTAKENIVASELNKITAKKTIILDCCRKNYPEIKTEIIEGQRKTASQSTINKEKCRKYYEEAIHNCLHNIIVLYSCSEDEYSAGFEERGGLYSYHLIKGAIDWAKNTAVPLSGCKILSVCKAHGIASTKVINTIGNIQTPDMLFVRSGICFPFCIIA